MVLAAIPTKNALKGNTGLPASRGTLAGWPKVHVRDTNRNACENLQNVPKATRTVAACANPAIRPEDTDCLCIDTTKQKTMLNS